MVRKKSQLRILESALVFFWRFGFWPDYIPILPGEYGWCNIRLRVRVVGSPEDGQSVFAYTKTCPECGAEYPLTDSYWYNNQGRPYSICRYCHREQQRSYRNRRYRQQISTTPRPYTRRTINYDY